METARSKSTYTAEYRRLRSLIVRARKDAGLTQDDVARLLKKPQSYISKVESGERRLDVVEFLHLLRALHSDPVRLLATLTRGRP